MKRALLFAALLALAGCDQLARVQAPSAEAARLADSAQIERIANAIDDAVDRKDWPLARSFFADRVETDFSTLGGTPSTISADDLIGNWKATLPEQKPSFHLRGEEIATIDGDAATLISRGYAWNMLQGRPAENNLWEVWGVYEHRFTRTPQGWRVNGFKFTKTYERGDPSIRAATP